MPIYEYQCDKCQHIFEELVFNDATPACPHCGAGETHKLMSACSHQGEGCRQPASSGGSGCAGCSGGHCSTCCAH
ncbi:MAG: zinc ribbon domain-containing protein [Desulfovibrionaceae bacterium]|nr:zinc ribbon domain-containing protein [Desulfovibrionaceae bacterium]